MERHAVQSIRAALVRHIENLHDTAQGTIRRMRSESGKCADSFEQAASEYDWSMELTMRERDRRLIREMRAAIARIDRGVYGVCDLCGTEITLERLILAPMSRLCVECTASLERQRKRIAGRPFSRAA